MNKPKSRKRGVNVTLASYGNYNGNSKSKLPTRRELTGYVPMERRIADLKAAGIRTAAVRDQRYFDEIAAEVDWNDLEIPPMPRHIPADLAEVSDLARYYSERQKIIEEKVREINEKRRELAHDAAGPSAPPEPPGKGAVEPEGSKK